MAIATVNPATGQVVKTFESLSDAQLEVKLQKAADTFLNYRKTPFAARARMMLSHVGNPQERFATLHVTGSSGKGSTALLLAALADDTPPLRRLGLELASTKPGFWGRSDAHEYLKRLLIDPDAQVRYRIRADWLRHQGFLK